MNHTVRAFSVHSTIWMKSLATRRRARAHGAIRHAIRSGIFQREILIIIFGNHPSSVIYRRIKGQQHFIAANIRAADNYAN